MAKTETKNRIEINYNVKEPSLYKVIYIDDEVTTMSFVIQTLVDHFSYNQDTAIDITESINREGSAVVAVLPFEIAEQKRHEIVADARREKFPLKIMIESD